MREHFPSVRMRRLYGRRGRPPLRGSARKDLASSITRQEIRFHRSGAVVKCGRDMKDFPTPLDLKKIKAYPLAQRRNLSALEELLTGVSGGDAACSDTMTAHIRDCVAKVTAARQRGASVMLIYGAHLVKNGLLEVINGLKGLASKERRRRDHNVGNFE
jgi:hypothetical protein